MARGVRNIPTIEPTDLDRAYAAGFVDGEGAISVRVNSSTKRNPTWNPSCYASTTVSQVDPRPLQWLQDRWGGAIRQMAKPRKDTERRAWEWCVAGNPAYQFLRDIEPMLKCKGENARNALRLRDVQRHRGEFGFGHRLTPEDVAAQEAIRQEARRLNARTQVWEVLP